MNRLKSQQIIQLISIPEKAPQPLPPESHFDIEANEKDDNIAHKIHINFSKNEKKKFR